jgi:hypothetical protein
MTDQIKRNFPRRYFAASVLPPHFDPLHSHGSLTLTSMQRRFNAGSFAEKFNITNYIHILTHFLTDKNSTHTKWQFSPKTAQGLNIYFIILKIARL